ncbi:hypothetical protein TNCV_746681 [Trichonephila clavipes]|nr:hypothetical protein TNCV_746681 [Trichonephila clavipes]
MLHPARLDCREAVFRMEITGSLSTGQLALPALSFPQSLENHVLLTLVDSPKKDIVEAMLFTRCYLCIENGELLLRTLNHCTNESRFFSFQSTLCVRV